MLLSVCMKDYVARSYGHAPRKLPFKGVPLKATSRFIAYQAPLLYTIFFYLSTSVKIFLCRKSHFFNAAFCATYTTQISTQCASARFPPCITLFFCSFLPFYYIYRYTRVITPTKSVLRWVKSSFHNMKQYANLIITKKFPFPLHFLLHF